MTMYKALHRREDLDVPYDKEKEEEKLYSVSEITSTSQSMNLKSAYNRTTRDYSQKPNSTETNRKMNRNT